MREGNKTQGDKCALAVKKYGIENFNFYNPGQKNIIKKEFNLSLNSYTRKKNYSYQKPINLRHQKKPYYFWIACP